MTRGCSSGTSWIAVAPVPTTATREPVRSVSWSQRAEWNTGPGNSARPSTSGSFGSATSPAALTSTSAVNSPDGVAIRQRASAASQRAESTSASKRTWSSRPVERARRRA
nr:hypothetical protein [Pseudonocardia sp. ICBG162]